MTSRARINSVVLAGGLIWLTLFYFLNLPQYVQGGDTGELVAASTHLYVPHPPGYPLWIWLQYLWIQFFPFGTVFWKASFLSALFGIGTLFIVGLHFRKSIAALLLLAVLGLSQAFIETTLLPDVFSLHALITGCIGVLYLNYNSQSNFRKKGIIALFILGLCHHHTIILLSPVWLALAIEEKTLSGRLKFLRDSCIGVGFAAALYCSLFLFHPNDYRSWGQIQDFRSLLNHFLRTDFGTFKLASDSWKFSLDAFFYFFKSSYLEIITVFVLCSFSLFRSKNLFKDRRYKVWILTCLFSVSFFLLANVSPVGMGKEVLLRFHVMPLLMLILLSCSLLERSHLKMKELKPIGALILITILIRIPALGNYNHLHEDSIFEDYAINLLHSVSHHESSEMKLNGGHPLILTEDDNVYFGVRYVQSVLNIHPELGIATPRLFFHPWYIEKLRKINPLVQLRHSEKVWNTRQLDFEKDLIDANVMNFPIAVTNGYQNGITYQVTFMRLGRLLTHGSGVQFDFPSPEDFKLRTQWSFELNLGPQSWSKTHLFSDYSHYFLSRGLKSYKEGQIEEAKRDWMNALSLVPYSLPALKNLCQVTHQGFSQCNSKTIEKMETVIEE